MKTIQVALQQWLVVDDVVKPRFLISVVPAVHRETGETLMRYRVDHWVLQREQRWQLGYYELLQEAIDACAEKLGMPEFRAPMTAPDGTIVTPAEQRARWLTGTDPRSGQPRTTSTS
ncbi:hypothetical protein [Leifsonia sp. PS1209]|uniref:hypothetical protein n=1 Tax=Leifsonia sp. PS1209 TaxID=2724914 RepID=UPI001442DFCC|nr:hypothetical protein [Leifsonia sp. PS1209]QJA00357.1 hypothetical protein HF024_18850 [Leifsonia sp. PS1209]